MSIELADIEKRVKNLLVRELDLDPIDLTPDAKIMIDLGADSLDIAELSLAIEDEFGMELSDEQMERLETVQQISNLIYNRMKSLTS
jgi:acyl carrier protein